VHVKAVVFREFGGPEVLHVEEVPLPEPKPGQVRIKVHAVSVNQTLDVGMRRGGAGIDVKLPMTPGIDPSGVVDAIGPEVADFRVGDRVAGSLPPPVSGGYAEYAVVNAASAALIPDSVDFATATAVGRHFSTAVGEMAIAQVQPGETVLIMGAAGAVASCLVQLCKEAGATVIAGAGADERVQAALSLGADHGINYRREPLTEQVMKLTDGKGVQVVLENVGDPGLWPQAVASLARGGRLLTIGSHGGDGVAPLDLRLLYRNRLHLMSGLGDRIPGRSETVQALQEVAKGKYRMIIDRILPLSQAAEAHRLVESNRVVGKVMIDPTLD
jgi:NADPH:quinone reductase-like Zn-dependent oxidoreductase